MCHIPSSNNKHVVSAEYYQWCPGVSCSRKRKARALQHCGLHQQSSRMLRNNISTAVCQGAMKLAQPSSITGQKVLQKHEILCMHFFYLPSSLNVPEHAKGSVLDCCFQKPTI